MGVIVKMRIIDSELGQSVIRHAKTIGWIIKQICLVWVIVTLMIVFTIGSLFGAIPGLYGAIHRQTAASKVLKPP